MLAVALLCCTAAAPPGYPKLGYKLQLNASRFTVNDYQCMEMSTKAWPSERVHCELRADGAYDWVVEHFDDPECTKPNAKLPVIRHINRGCFYYATFNQSYNDECQANRTVTVSAFSGPGCLEPMPVTAMNLKPEL